MKLKILYLILFILMFMPIGLCEIIKEDINLNNTKIYNENDKTIFIYDKNNEKSMDIKLISTISDIDKFVKIIEITNYIEYIPDKKDFITKTKKVYGKNNIYKTEYFIEKYNYTFDYIIINKTIFNNKTGKNETILINKSIIKDIKPFWVKFKPYNRIIFKNETFKLKIIHYKKSELGFFKIQTIPIFKNIECKEFTWFLGNWNLKRAILINNINGDNVTNYQLKSVNLSEYQINASSTRIINESSGLQENFWNESIDSNGNLEFVWCNFSNIINNTWVNKTYYIYYQSNPNVNSISNGNATFLFFDNFSNNLNQFDISGTPTIIGGIVYLNDNDIIVSKTKFGYGYCFEGCSKADEQDINLISAMETIANENNLLSIMNTDGNLDDFDKFRMAMVEGGAWTQDNNDNWDDFRITYLNYRIKRPAADDVTFEQMGNSVQYTSGNIPTVDLGLAFRVWDSSQESILQVDWGFVRKYIINEPELWTVGNIEYPEGLDMTCNLKIITHLTDKKVQIVDMNASIVNESYTNECINLSYDSYIVYMSNPVKISSFTGLLNILDNFLIQALLFIFLIVIATLFYVFVQIVKKKGFKL